MLDRVVCGQVPKKHHIALYGGAGELRYEECLTREGFDGPYTILYHERRPHLQHAGGGAAGFPLPAGVATPALARRHYRSFELPRGSAEASLSRVPLLFNEDIVIGCAFPAADDTRYFSNADADDVFFVHEGGGVLRSPFGDLRFGAGDYVCVPKGVLHRYLLDAQVAQYWLSLECRAGLGLPRQWRNAVGQLRMDAPYSHRDFRRPEFAGPRDEGLRELIVKRRGGFHRFRYDASPLDVVGWDGTVYPWAFAIGDFQPRVGQVHLPPTWHGTFVSQGTLICSFVPRPLDFHPEAVPCPYPHTSVDVDEVIFYCRGQFTSRKGIAAGSISHHPPGIVHGPHPGAYEASIGKRWTDELAVMLDCYAPLQRTPEAAQIEDSEYHESFQSEA
jgi:homogentisate 1,2-dioxygenase